MDKVDKHLKLRKSTKDDAEDSTCVSRNRRSSTLAANVFRAIQFSSDFTQTRRSQKSENFSYSNVSFSIPTLYILQSRYNNVTIKGVR